MRREADARWHRHLLRLSLFCTRINYGKTLKSLALVWKMLLQKQHHCSPVTSISLISLLSNFSLICSLQLFSTHHTAAQKLDWARFGKNTPALYHLINEALSQRLPHHPVSFQSSNLRPAQLQEPSTGWKNNEINNKRSISNSMWRAKTDMFDGTWCSASIMSFVWQCFNGPVIKSLPMKECGEQS